MKYIIQDRECGNYIDSFSTEREAKLALQGYEEQDKREKVYTPDFYEIVEGE